MNVVRTVGTAMEDIRTALGGLRGLVDIEKALRGRKLTAAAADTLDSLSDEYLDMADQATERIDRAIEPELLRQAEAGERTQIASLSPEVK